MKDKYNQWIMVGFIIVIIIFTNNKTYQMLPTDQISGQSAMNGATENLSQYLVETSDFDISNPEIQALAQAIKSKATSQDDQVKQTIKYVYNNVKYTSVAVSYCYSEKASTVLSLRQGDCVSMSRAVTALLRAQGIPSRTMGGCLSFSKSCGVLFAAIPGAIPQTTPMVEGDFKKRGFLHEYVEAYIEGRGWVRIEATSGQIFPLDCSVYLNYGYDDVNTRCTINDQNFWNQCKGY